MKKKILILTTDTVHHTFFVKKISDFFGNVFVYSESISKHKYHFTTDHPFEQRRNHYEINKWFSGNEVKISEIANTRLYEDLNSESAIDALSREEVDVVVTFGTRFLKKEIIDLFPGKIFNLHGGDTSRYRGLDSHLWAIYHKDFDALITTLHHLDQDLDAGSIVMQGEIELSQGMSIESLRAVNTELCITMTCSLIDCILRSHIIPSRKLWNLGRYYSAMPTELKEVCVKRFDNYTKHII
jgi:methionyl-tRNA formyltransferase